MPTACSSKRPRLVAEALFPLVVEAVLAQRRAERIRLRAVEGQALGGEIGLHRFVELADVFALLQAGVVDRIADDVLQVGRQGFPRAAAGEEPEAVPDVVGEEQYFCTS